MKFYKGIVCSLLLGTLLSACATKSIVAGEENVQTVYVGYNAEAPVPPGVVRYCWEEPVVEFQDNGPGLNGDKTYYQPSHVAIRMVKQGRWRPCAAQPSEIRGETKNER